MDVERHCRAARPSLARQPFGGPPAAFSQPFGCPSRIGERRLTLGLPLPLPASPYPLTALADPTAIP